MASNFTTLFADTALPAIIDLHGETGRVTVTAAGGSPVAVADVLIGDEKVEVSAEGTGQVVGYSREVTFLVSLLPSLKSNAKVTVDGVVYSVKSTPAGNGETITATIYRAAAGEVSRPDYRAQRGA